MSNLFAVTTARPISGPVANAGTFRLAYPVGETVNSPWDTTGHILGDTQGNFYIAGFSVNFGADYITITNDSLGTLAAGRTFRLQAAKYTLSAVPILTEAGAAILDDADASAQRTSLGLAIGVNVQAYSANLDAVAAVTVSAAGTALLDDASADAQIATLGGAAGTGTGGLVRKSGATLIAPILGAASATSLATSGNVGVAGTGVTAAEYGDGRTHQTVLTVNTTLPAIAGGAALGVGKLLYTLPAGAQVVDGAYMSLAITQTQAHINADTPKVGLGTVIASGVVSVLNGTATFMNLITEQTAANCTGTATVKTANPTAAVPFVTEAAGSKAIYANAAATWAALGDAAALLTGTVVINWRFMN